MSSAPLSALTSAAAARAVRVARHLRPSAAAAAAAAADEASTTSPHSTAPNANSAADGAATRANRWVLVFGGAGSLGRALVDVFKRAGFKVASVDFAANDAANISVSLRDVPWSEQLDRRTQYVADYLRVQLGEDRFRLVVSVAGGFAAGHIKDFKVFASTRQMLEMNVESAVAVAHIASKLLMQGGLVVLTGAQAALGPTPQLIGYGMSKSAVHQLCASLAHPEGGLPRGGACICIMPVMLDTPANRRAQPSADTSSWTPLPHIADKLLSWVQNPPSRPSNGALISVVTQRSATTWILQHNPFM